MTQHLRKMVNVLAAGSVSLVLLGSTGARAVADDSSPQKQFPVDADSDGDGFPDAFERQVGSDPNTWNHGLEFRLPQGLLDVQALTPESDHDRDYLADD